MHPQYGFQFDWLWHGNESVRPHYMTNSAVPEWEDTPPLASPFTGIYLCLTWTFFLCERFTRAFRYDSRNGLWIMLTLAVIPVCTFQEDRFCTTRILSANQRSRSCIRTAVSLCVHSISSLRKKHSRVARWVLPLVILCWYLFVYWDQPVSSRTTLEFTPQWHTQGTHDYLNSTRVGEAANPVPEFAISTLNVASIICHQEALCDPVEIPTVRVLTETCLTESMLPTISRKTRSTRRFLVPSKLCAPRKSATKSDSHVRGESGGTLISSDLPARPGNTPLDATAWLSTRVCEALVAVSPELTVRVIGVYGFSTRYPHHTQATNNLLCRLLGIVAQSSIPCFFAGDFNCQLDDLSWWQVLITQGWTCAAHLQSQRDGKPIQPTWNSLSHIDFILVPPQMIPFFTKYHNEPDTVSDHSLITAQFSVPGPCPMRHVWRTCRDSRSIVRTLGWYEEDYLQIDWESFHSAVSSRNVDKAYTIFCINFENMIGKAHQRTSEDTPIRQFFGRSQPKIVSQPLHAPVVPNARQGDLQTQFDDAPICLRQRIRQARRIKTVIAQLQNVVRLDDPDQRRLAYEATTQTWVAVLRSTGFRGGFLNFASRSLGIYLPQWLRIEDLTMLYLVDDLMKSHLQSWKSKLSTKKQHLYTNFMASDWSRGGRIHFNTIRPPPKPEIALLEIPFPFQVTRRKHSKKGPFILRAHEDPPEGIAYIQFGDQRRTVNKVDGRNVYLDAPLSASHADLTVIGMRPTGSLQDIHAMAVDYWDSFWRSEDETNLTQVQEVMRDFQPIPPFDSGITYQELKEALGKIKLDKARGPDSWSPWELKNLPEPFLLALASLLNLFTETATWPKPITQAKVSMLSKVDGAFQVEQTRPITILSLVYRVWSRIYAAKFIRHVQGFLPAAIQGNRPGLSSKWLSAHIQFQIESALTSDEGFHLISLDLTKAYNLLSRVWIRQCSPRFGVPGALTEAYLSFLGSLQRRFKVHASLSEPVTSLVGVPEGCAYAVYNMLQLNWYTLVHVDKQQLIQSAVVFVNYVDNWLFHSNLEHALKHTIQEVHALAGFSNFRISKSKTWGSSTLPGVRSRMASWNFGGYCPSVHPFKLALGSVLKFTRKLTSQDVSSRWSDGIQRIGRLVFTSWGISRKIAVIRRGVFPQVFAGCELSHVSLSTFKKFRSKLNVAVHGPRTTSSHFLAPLFTDQSEYEPFLYVFRCRLTTLRAMFFTSGYGDLPKLWDHYASIDLNTHPTKILGPLGYFMWGCQVLGWIMPQTLTCRTQDGTVLHLLESPEHFWRLAAAQSWVNYCVKNAKMKAELRPDHIPWLSFKSLTSQKAFKESPLALKCRTLGVLSGSALATIHNLEASCCEFCNAPEAGQMHLILRCDKVQPLRDDPRFARLKEAPVFTRCTGIPTSTLALRRESLQSPSPTFSCNNEVVYLFTDGSANPSALPNVRLSSWALVVAHTIYGDFQPRLSGITPGPWHSIARAETYAVLVAIQSFRNLHIICDNKGVVTRLRFLLANPFLPLKWRGHPNFDLWSQIAQLIITRPGGLIQISKVKSHVHAATLQDPWVRWISTGNDRADSLAKSTLSTHVAQRFDQVPQWKPEGERKSLEVATLATLFLHEMSDMLFKTRNENTQDPPSDPAPSLASEDLALFQFYPFQVPDPFPGHKWDRRWLQLALHYFSLLKWAPVNPLDVGISCLEVLLDFLISFQIHPPLNSRRLKKQGNGITLTWDPQECEYHLPSRAEASILPPPLLTECSFIWLRTLDYLESLLSFTPHPRASLRTLRPFTYDNVVSSWPVRPALLAGHAASQYLSSVIKPRTRTLKYRFLLPPRQARPLPPSLAGQFHS